MPGTNQTGNLLYSASNGNIIQHLPHHGKPQFKTAFHPSRQTLLRTADRFTAPQARLAEIVGVSGNTISPLKRAGSVRPRSSPWSYALHWTRNPWMYSVFSRNRLRLPGQSLSVCLIPLFPRRNLRVIQNPASEPNKMEAPSKAADVHGRVVFSLFH